MHFNDLVCIPVFQAYLTHYFLNKHTYFAYFLACMPLYLIHVNGSRFLFMPLIISDTHSDAHSLQSVWYLYTSLPQALDSCRLQSDWLSALPYTSFEQWAANVQDIVICGFLASHFFKIEEKKFSLCACLQLMRRPNISS